MREFILVSISDAQILADRDRSFDLFRTVYPKHQTIEDNKALLKSKYDEAKAVAEQVNAARSETNRLKQEIERVRVEVAMANIVETGGAGGGKAADEASIPEGEAQAHALAPDHRANSSGRRHYITFPYSITLHHPIHRHPSSFPPTQALRRPASDPTSRRTRQPTSLPSRDCET